MCFVEVNVNALFRCISSLVFFPCGCICNFRITSQFVPSILPGVACGALITIACFCFTLLDHSQSRMSRCAEIYHTVVRRSPFSWIFLPLRPGKVHNIYFSICRHPVLHFLAFASQLFYLNTYIDFFILFSKGNVHFWSEFPDHFFL